MINMCGKRRAMLVSVMDGQRPQIRCEGRWRAPYMAVRYGSAVRGGRGMCQSRSRKPCTGSLGASVGKVGATGYLLLEREAESGGTRSQISRGESF